MHVDSTIRDDDRATAFGTTGDAMNMAVETDRLARHFERLPEGDDKLRLVRVLQEITNDGQRA